MTLNNFPTSFTHSTAMKPSYLTALAIAVITGVSTSSSNAQLIGVINHDSAVVTGGPKTLTLSFDAGEFADKLIVQVGSENSAGVPTVTYNGEALTSAAGTAIGRNEGIFYLDDPFTGGAADLTVDMSGITTVNGISLGAVSVIGTDSGVDATASNGASDVMITTTTAGSFVVAGHASNGGGSVTADSPLNPIYEINNIGSARGAAGYESGVAVGLPSYSFSGTGASPATSAAAFAPANDGRVAITDLFNTGVNDSRIPLGNDVDDPHYDIVDFGGGGPLADSTVPSPPGVWFPNDPDARWIGEDNSSTNGTAQPGLYTYETTFTVGANADLSTVLISGRWATDNGGVDLLLNGVSVGETSPGFGSLVNFVIDSTDAAFVHGTNTLTFQINNAGGSPNPTGLRVDDLVGWYHPVPEPTSVALWSLIGIGLAGFGRRRR